MIGGVESALWEGCYPASALAHGVCVLVYDDRPFIVLTETKLSSSCLQGQVRFGGGVLLFILGSSLGGVGPVRGLRGGGRGGWCEEWSRIGYDHPTFFIPLVLGPPNSLLWYVPSLRYTHGLGWRMHCGAEVTESSTNKQHHLSLVILHRHSTGKHPAWKPPTLPPQGIHEGMDAGMRSLAPHIYNEASVPPRHPTTLTSVRV